jgi:hypothetical protein
MEQDHGNRGRYRLPIAVRVTSSSPNESTLVEDTLGGLPKRLIADRAYDSDPVDERLRQKHSLELICAQSRQAKANSGWTATAPLRRGWRVERLLCLAEELPRYL